MDLLFIDGKLEEKDNDNLIEASIVNEVIAAFSSSLNESSLEVIKANSGEEAFAKLEEVKKTKSIGSFAAIALEDQSKSFGKVFPNNTIAAKESLDEAEAERISKQVIWMLNSFGREKKNMTNNTWVISDTHFWHENIIKYCSRPYASVAEMNEDMVAKWNAVVKKDDIVWHLGDFCFGAKEHVKEIVSRLNGRISLVLGNHDHHKPGFYYDSGFHRVYDHPVVVSDFFILSHAPLQWVKDGDAYANVYGHVHAQEMYRDFTTNSFCACVERLGYAPIRWSDMLKKMKSASALERHA